MSQQVISIVLMVFGSILGLWNAVVMFILNRKAKAQDEREERMKRCEERLTALEGQQLTAEKVREVIKSELTAFELRLIQKGQIDVGGVR